MKEAYVSPIVDVENKVSDGAFANVGAGAVVLVLAGVYLVVGAVAGGLVGVVWVATES